MNLNDANENSSREKHLEKKICIKHLFVLILKGNDAIRLSFKIVMPHF